MNTRNDKRAAYNELKELLEGWGMDYSGVVSYPDNLANVASWYIFEELLGISLLDLVLKD